MHPNHFVAPNNNNTENLNEFSNFTLFTSQRNKRSKANRYTAREDYVSNAFRFTS